MREVIARIVDRSEFDEYKAEFGRTVLVRLRADRRQGGGDCRQSEDQPEPDVAMGPAAGMKRIEVGGVIYTEGAQKAARFIMDCNQNLVPLVFLHDVNGFMVGKDAEWSGIIRAGAKMVSAVSTSVVPKISVIVGGSFGAGHYAMCGKAYDPRFPVCLADGALCGDERRIGGEHACRGARQADGARRKDPVGAEKKALYDEIKDDVRCPGRSALWRGAALD
jgi:3-methylcrotonyl-CoA carboxylase beta subunit